jgi:hypothetical protein
MTERSILHGLADLDAWRREQAIEPRRSDPRQDGAIA